ncbi:MAG: hypothetical protein V4667_05640 [Bacteroidota bacterium]
MKNNKWVSEIINISNQVENRLDFHHKAGTILPQMQNDKGFWEEVIKRNFTDEGYLNRNWTLYDIPFFYIYENEDFYLKVHIFPPAKNYNDFEVAHCIHHHNNYIITTLAAFGSGYRTFLFEKEIDINPVTKETKLKIKEHFSQQERPVHTVDAWQPHVVINPISLSATINLWSPDKKRATDKFRSNPILKALKSPLRKIIYALKLDKSVGISAKETHQFYIKDKKFWAILEDDYFAPTRNAKGDNAAEYCLQSVFCFVQRVGFSDMQFLEQMKTNKSVPKSYHKWIDMILKGEQIPDTFAKEEINTLIPKTYLKDIIEANNLVNNQ